MKTIIAGTDFTPSSLNACRYAAFLALKLNCKLTIFNLFESPILHSNSGLYGISYSAVRTDSEKKTATLLARLREEFPRLETGMFVSGGSFREELETFVAKHHVEAAVMGLEAKSRVSKFIWGSHGVDLAGRINAPVIIVPQHYKEHRLSRILLAVDNTEKLHKTSLKELEQILQSSGASLKVLHVRTDREIFGMPLTAISVMGKKTDIRTIEAIDVQTGVKHYCSEHKIDLVAIISQKHSAFYNLFSETNTKKVAFTARVPVLAIHG